MLVLIYHQMMKILQYTEEILLSEEKDCKVDPPKDKRKIIKIVNKINNRNNKIEKR
jgi:hypothetical protein